MIKRTPKLLIIAAMKEEIHRSIRGLKPFNLPLKDSSGKQKQCCWYWEPEKYDGSVAFFCCGVGGKRARKTLNQILRYVSPENTVISGFAGAFDIDVHVGDLVLTDAVYHCDQNNNFPIVFDDKVMEILDQSLRKLGVVFHRGAAVCSDRMIDRCKDKQRLLDKFPVKCVDMESYHLLKILQENNVPTAMIRVISDYADESLGLDFGKLPSEKWQQRIYFLTHPAHYLALQRLKKTALATTRRLDKAISAAISQILKTS